MSMFTSDGNKKEPRYSGTLFYNKIGGGGEIRTPAPGLPRLMI